MPENIFAKIGDIKGESLDAKHKDEIEVLSFSWGVATPPPAGGGGGGGAGKPIFQDLTIVHGIDKATPALLQACATGVKDASRNGCRICAAGVGGFAGVYGCRCL